MTGKTHLTAGLLTGMCVAFRVGADPTSVLGLSCAGVLGGLFPDIDLPHSKAGKTAKPVSYVISKVSRHRGVFHAPVLYAAAGLTAYHFFPDQLSLIAAFAGGCASHLFLDSLTRQGIPVFWPFKSRLSLLGVKTGGFWETLIRLLLIAAIGLVIYTELFQ